MGSIYIWARLSPEERYTDPTANNALRQEILSSTLLYKFCVSDFYAPFKPRSEEPLRRIQRCCTFN